MELDLAPTVKQALGRSWEPVYRSQLHYLVTWSTRGRRPVLKDRHIEALRGLIRATCEERHFELVEVVAGQDHVHVLFGLRPAQSVASAVRELKGRTGMALLAQFPELRVWLRGNLVWDERYSVETVSPLRLDTLRERLSSRHRNALEEFAAGWAEAS
ncbi:MAG: IS200/IS605 family transposase [Candidatus Eisenbacteria bacterium]|nr:IS200/IS605 family transposase [Candidatus Eisenbacteria bacterium]